MLLTVPCFIYKITCEKIRKKRFFDDRLKYLSFIQNTGEKSNLREDLFTYFKTVKNKSYIRVLDAGTGDGTIFNMIKSFHKYHP